MRTNQHKKLKKSGRELSFLFSLVLALMIFLICCNSSGSGNNHKDSLALKKDSILHPPPDTPFHHDPNKKVIYLTFDDGPNEGTSFVYKAVKEEKVPATFFIVGSMVLSTPRPPDIWNQMMADHTIALCNHSYNHANGRYKLYYSNPAGVVKDIQHNNDALHFNHAVVRMPGRNAWRIGKIDFTDLKASKPAIDSVHKAGFSVMGWDAEWDYNLHSFVLKDDGEAMLRQIDELANGGNTRTPGHVVLLMHDLAFRTQASIAQLHILMKGLKENPQYELSLVPYYPGVRK